MGGNSTSGSAGSGQELPLKGVRVLELAHIVAGPSAGLIMGDLGAEAMPAMPVQANSAANPAEYFFTEKVEPDGQR